MTTDKDFLDNDYWQTATVQTSNKKLQMELT